MTSRPNTLLITSDQQHADCFGFENRHIKTPHTELVVLGHLHRTRSLEHPPVGHYERWLLSRLPEDRS